MKNIAVGIITFQRPSELERLLDGIAAQEFEPGEGESAPEVTVVVVDTAASGSARAVCDSAMLRHGLKISYIFEPKQGIAIARNRVLDSLPDGCEAVAWIDDDAVPDAKWLHTLIVFHKGAAADIVLGAVQAILPEGAPEWIRKGGFYNRRRFIDRATLGDGSINNSFLVVDSIRQAGLRFDETIRYVGGTDALFFRTAEKKDLRIVWAGEALVQDYISLERATLKALMRRHFRVGITLAFCDVHLDGIRGWIRRLGKGIGKFVRGIFMLPVGLEGMHEMGNAYVCFARASGMIAGLFGYRVNEPVPKRDTKDGQK